MPYLRFDWHEHIKDIEGEYKTARFAIDRLNGDFGRDSALLHQAAISRKHLRETDNNLEGTYIVRLFAAFEAALRSYDQARHKDPERQVPASILIDSTGGPRALGISNALRQGAHEVRKVRNFWAHETDAPYLEMSISEARARLQVYLSRLSEQWG